MKITLWCGTALGLVGLAGACSRSDAERNDAGDVAT
jgi:hypothetical protein